MKTQRDWYLFPGGASIISLSHSYIGAVCFIPKLAPSATSNATRLRWSMCLVFNSGWTCTAAAMSELHQVTLLFCDHSSHGRFEISSCVVDFRTEQAKNKHFRLLCIMKGTNVPQETKCTWRTAEPQVYISAYGRLAPLTPPAAHFFSHRKPDYLCLFLYPCSFQLDAKDISSLNPPQSIISRWALTLNNRTLLMVISFRSH